MWQLVEGTVGNSHLYKRVQKRIDLGFGIKILNCEMYSVCHGLIT